MALKRLEELNSKAEDPDLWQDQEKAQALMRERTRLDESIKSVTAVERELTDNLDMIEMAEAEGDADIVAESEAAISRLFSQAERMEVETLLSGEADPNDSYLEVHAGAGGTESQDWASMLLRMYLRWAEKKGFKTEIIEETSGEEAGIKSATVKISGHNSYGWAKTEPGVHRLVLFSTALFIVKKTRLPKLQFLWTLLSPAQIRSLQQTVILIRRLNSHPAKQLINLYRKFQQPRRLLFVRVPLPRTGRVNRQGQPEDCRFLHPF